MSAYALLRQTALPGLLALLTSLAFVTPASAQPVSEQPFPVLETGMHTAPIKRFAVDRADRYGVSASDDKTARVWNLADGRLLQTLRVPVGQDEEGKLYAVAISPDGEQVAVGGYTGKYSGEQSVYFFERASGRIKGRIAGLPDVVFHLAWSPDGQRLAIALGGNNGIRVHAMRAPYAEIAKDTNYGEHSLSVDFDRSGRLVSTSLDGKLRLYDADLHLQAPPRAAGGGTRPFSARFSPDGRHIAVGFHDSTAVSVVSGADLGPLAAMDTGAADNGNLSKVSWSADGRRLFAAGRNQLGDGQLPVRVFEPVKGRQLAAWPVSTNTVMDLQPLADGRLLFAAQDPTWGIVGPDGALLTGQTPPIPDHRGNFDGFRLSASGDRLAFTHETWQQGRWQRQSVQFDLNTLTLTQGDAAPSQNLTPPRRDGLAMEKKDWFDTTKPTLAGKRLPLKNYESSRSLAIAADTRHFALGTDWYVRWFDAQGRQQWQKPVPGVARLVNTSADGRFVVAALGDGTIRWYRTADGSEALALFVHADARRWVVWTPEGFYAASSPEAESLMGYVLNQGRDKEAEFVSSGQLREQFYRPALIAARIAGNEAPIAAALKEVGDVRQVLAGGLAPEIELVSEPQATVDGAYDLQVKITPRAGGIGRISLRKDGAEQAAGRGEAPIGGVYSERLRYPPGRYKIEVAVFDARNRLLSKTRSIDLTVKGVAARPRLHVLAVGVSSYYDPSLREGVSYAAADAAALVDTLQKHGDTDLMDLAPPVLLKDTAASRDNIVAALQRLAQSAQAQDVVVLFLAGHGTEDKGDYFYQPWEAKYTSRARLLEQSVSGEQLRTLLREVKAGKALVLLDTCASSKFYLASRSMGQQEAVARFASLSGRAVISASAGKAREHEKLAHGLFTDALLRGLAGAAADAKGKVMVSGLADFIEENVESTAVRLFNEPQLTQREFTPEFRNFAVSRKR